MNFRMYKNSFYDTDVLIVDKTLFEYFEQFDYKSIVNSSYDRQIAIYCKTLPELTFSNSK